MSSTNPGNFANRPTEEVQAIASKGGKASHTSSDSGESKENNPQPCSLPGRNPDGTFTKGSEAASAAGHLGGMHSHGGKEEEEEKDKISPPPKSHTFTESHPRNADGTFAKTSTSDVTHQARNADGTFAQKSETETESESAEAGAEAAHPPGRNADGTFVKGSAEAAAAGHLGGLHSHAHSSGKKDVNELEVQAEEKK